MKTLFALSFVILLTACVSTGPEVTSNADPSMDFSNINTFNFMQPLGTDRPDGIRTPLSSMLINAVARELKARGMSLSESPDVAVNFFVNTEQRFSVRQSPAASSFHGYRRGRYRAWGGYETRVRNFTLGTLSIDLADLSRNMLVWEGVAQGILDRGIVNINQAEVDEVVAAVLKELPQ